MTADIRTAAQREAESRTSIARSLGSDYDTADLEQGFVNGAVWGVARVTPTREQIAEALGMAYSSSPYRDAHLRGADAALALMQRIACGEHKS